MGQNPAIPVDHAEQPVTPRDRAPAVDARPARFVGARPDQVGPRRSRPTSPCATGSTTRAATTIPSSSATTGSGEREIDRATRSASRRRRDATPTPRGAAGAGAAGRRPTCIAAARRAAAARAARGLRGPRRAHLRQPARVPRAFVVGRQRVVVGDEDARWTRSPSPASTRAREAIVRAVARRRLGGTGGGADRRATSAERVELSATHARRGAARARRRCLPGLAGAASTAARCRSSASTTCCAASRVGPASTDDRHDLRAVELAAGWIVSLLAALGLLAAAMWKGGRR